MARKNPNEFEAIDENQLAPDDLWLVWDASAGRLKKLLQPILAKASALANYYTKTQSDDRYLQADDISGLGTGDMLGRRNLNELTDLAEARDNLGLGDAATRAVGTGTGDVAAGDAPAAAVTAHAGATDPHGDRAYADTGDATTLSEAQSYADGLVMGLLDDRGSYDASSNLWPDGSTAPGNLGGSGPAHAIMKGDLWTLSVTGTLGGTSYPVGTLIRALTDSPGQTAGNWAVAAVPFGFSPENQANKKTIAPTSGSTDTEYLSAKAVYNWVVSTFQTTLGYIAENISNKSTGIGLDPTSTTKYPHFKAVYDWATSVFAALSGFTMAGAISMAGNLINQPKLKDFREALGTASISGGVLTLDFSTGASFAVTLTANITSVICSNVPATGQMVSLVMELTQDGTGGRTVAWGSAFKWPGGTAPTITSAAGSVDIIGGYTRDGGTTWRLARAHTDSK